MSDPLTETVSRRVRELRSAAGMGQEDLAAALAEYGVRWTRSNVAKLESGRRASISVTETAALAAVLGVPMQALLVEQGASQWQVTAEKAFRAYPAMLWLLGLRENPAGPPRYFLPVGPEWMHAARDMENLLAYADDAHDRLLRTERNWQREGDVGAIEQAARHEQRRELEKVETNLLTEILEDLAVNVHRHTGIAPQDVITPALRARMTYYFGPDHDPYKRINEMVEELERGD